MACANRDKLSKSTEEREADLQERERLIAEREAALDQRTKANDEREKDLLRRENSFERANLEQEWAELVDEQAKFYKTGPGLTSLAITEKKQKLHLKKQQLKRLAGHLKAWERDLRLGVVYPCYTNPYTCRTCGKDTTRSGGVMDPIRNIPNTDECSEDSEDSD
jgi:hypothetical protein